FIVDWIFVSEIVAPTVIKSKSSFSYCNFLYRFKRPRNHCNYCKDKRNNHMTCTRTAERTRCCSTGELEEDSSICPFLQPRETREEDGYASENFPDTDDRHK